MLKFIFYSAVISLSLTTFAGELSDPKDQESLDKTVELLNSRTQRQEVIDKSADAKKADDMAKKLLGEGADLDKIYEIAGKIMRDVANKNNGDVSQMTHSIKEAQKNPEGFFNQLSPEQQQMIKALAEQVEKNRQGEKP